MAYTIYKPTTAVRGVLFDMDGVILDTEKLYTRFWLEGAHALGFPMTREQAIGLRGMNLGEAARMIGTYFGSPDYYQPIKNKRIELMDAYIAQHGVEPKTGIREILEYLQENRIPRAVCTASPIERVKRYLIPLGLFDDFDAICTAYDVAQGKPEPDIYLYGAKVLGKAPASCIAIEDSAAGIQSAAAAGCMATLVPDQDLPDAATLGRVTVLADSLLDVIEVIKGCNS